MLDEFCALTDYNRKYAGRILSKVGSAKKTKPPPGRPAPYRGQSRIAQTFTRAFLTSLAVVELPPSLDALFGLRRFQSIEPPV